MRDFPPDSLISRLIELRLCTTRDIQRATRLVRRMTRDLPAFDSVWIDALAQRNVLTPFQARWLETAPPETLIAGDYVLLDGLGAGTASQTFLARNTATRRRAVIKRLFPADDQAADVELRLQLLVERSRNCQSPHLAVPTGFLQDGDRLFVISQDVPGLNLRELLIRRGRFPADVVLSILDQLLAGLSDWHATGAVHGDLRLTKLRLTDGGQIVLVDCGVRTAVFPELLVHQVRTSEEADVIAPERIGTNQPATAATDLYAVGCVCWQLLTGRSPHLPADPLAKLAAHQTRRISDVRELAPDTPAKLAEMLLLLTSPNPQDRPTNAEAARRRLGFRGKPRRYGLASFRRQFDASVPHLATPKTRFARRWQGMTAAAVVLGISILVLSDRGLRTELLHIAERTWPERFASADDGDPQATGDAATEPSDRLLPIPAPNAQGVITLTQPGPYEIRTVSQVGPLTVQAADGISPRIVISADAWKISAKRVLLKGLDLEWVGSSAPVGPAAFIHLRSQQFQMIDCRMIGPETVGPDAVDPVEFSAVVWEPADRRDPQAGVLEVERTSFTGSMNALTCLSTPREATFRQVLKLHRGSLLMVAQASTRQSLNLAAEHLTLREAGPLLTCAGPLTEQQSASLIEISARDCVFDLAKSSPLVEFQGPRVRPDWAEAIRMNGDGCLLPPEAILLTHHDPQAELTSVLKSDELLFEGIFADEFEFAGDGSADPQDSGIVKTQAPRRPGAPLPGIDADQLR